MTTSAYARVPASSLDSFHSLLMEDEQFQEALQRVSFEVAEKALSDMSCEYDEEDIYDLAMELCCRVSVS